MSARLLLVVLVTALLVSVAMAEDVSRTPPALYHEQLEKYLTPLEKVREASKQTAAAASGSGYEVVLDERIVFVAENGQQTEVEHKIGHILSPAGLEKGAEWQADFSSSYDRYYVALAQTVRADGQIEPVDAKAISLGKTGGNSARPSEKDDCDADALSSDMVTVKFPDAAPGSLVEWILVREDLDSLKSDHFETSYTWGGRNLIRTKRLLLALPDRFQKSLHWQGLGAVVPEPSKTPGDKGFTIWEWTSQDIPPLAFEPDIPRLEEAKHFLALSTFSDWREAGRWAASTLCQSPENADICRKKAAEWTEGLSDPSEIVARLYSHVANDLRYEARNVAQHRFQPRAPDVVLNSGYGDCKDKSNLLRILLQTKGIHSRIALLHAHHGHIGGQSFPGPSYFNHAIVAVDLPGQTDPLYCDATSHDAPPGYVVQGYDYDTLLLNEDGSCEWSRAPKAKMGKFQTAVDLDLLPGGGISGWVTLTMDGVAATYFRGCRAKHDHGWMCDEFSGLRLGGGKTSVADFEVIQPPPGSAPDAECYRLYVLRPGSAITSAAGGEKALFPVNTQMAPKLSGKRERRSSYFVPAMEGAITGSIRLPKAWKITNIPTAFDRSVPGYTVKVAWRREADRLVVNGSMNSEGGVLEAGQFTQLWDLEHDFADWVGRGATLERGSLKVAAKAEKSVKQVWPPPLDALPKMPSAEGEVRLLGKWFAVEDSTDLPQPRLEARKAAFARAHEWYPDDANLAFEERFTELVDQIQKRKFANIQTELHPLLIQPDGKVDKYRLCLARLKLCALLVQNERPTEAVEIADSLMADSVLPMIRPTAAAIAARALEKTDPPRALRYARQSFAADVLPDEIFSRAFRQLFSLLAKAESAQPSTIVEEFNGALRRMPKKAALMRAAIAELPGELLQEGNVSPADKCWQAAQEAAKDGGFSEKQLATLAQTGEKLKKPPAPAHARKHLQG